MVFRKNQISRTVRPFLNSASNVASIEPDWAAEGIEKNEGMASELDDKTLKRAFLGERDKRPGLDSLGFPNLFFRIGVIVAGDVPCRTVGDDFTVTNEVVRIEMTGRCVVVGPE